MGAWFLQTRHQRRRQIRHHPDGRSPPVAMTCPLCQGPGHPGIPAGSVGRAWLQPEDLLGPIPYRHNFSLNVTPEKTAVKASAAVKGRKPRHPIIWEYSQLRPPSRHRRRTRTLSPWGLGKAFRGVLMAKDVDLLVLGHRVSASAIRRVLKSLHQRIRDFTKCYWMVSVTRSKRCL